MQLLRTFNNRTCKKMIMMLAMIVIFFPVLFVASIIDEIVSGDDGCN